MFLLDSGFKAQIAVGFSMPSLNVIHHFALFGLYTCRLSFRNRRLEQCYMDFEAI
jgi:hypothetical protein